MARFVGGHIFQSHLYIDHPQLFGDGGVAQRVLDSDCQDLAQLELVT